MISVIASAPTHRARSRQCVIGGAEFGGESASASFLLFHGTVSATDKDGPIMDLLAAKITAHTGRDPGEHYRRMTASERLAAFPRGRYLPVYAERFQGDDHPNAIVSEARKSVDRALGSPA